MFRYRILTPVILISMVGLLGACCPQSAPPSVSEIHMQPAQPGYTIMVGKEASLGVAATGGTLRFQWKAEKGGLSSPNSASTLYTAPDSPGLDTVSVTVTDNCGNVTVKSISIQVISDSTPTPTPTLPPTSTSTATFTATQTPTSTRPPTHTPTSSPSPSPSPTPTMTPAPTAVVIDGMESLAGWGRFNDAFGSAINISTTAEGMLDNAMRVDFDLKQGGFVGISKVIAPAPLSGTQGLRFFYTGAGPTDTIELKLLYKPDANGKGEVFSYSQREIAGADHWVVFEQGYSAFDCGDTCKVPGQKVDPARVWRMEIAVSHQLAGAPGVGHVILDQIEALKSFPCASCAGCVTGRGYGCPTNMEAVGPGPSDRSCTDTYILSSPITTPLIHIEMTKRALERFGYSLYEVEAYGPDDPTRNLLNGGAASASSIEDERYIASNATDGAQMTRWASAKCCNGENCPRDDKGNLNCDNPDGQDPQSLEITLPQPALVNRIVLKWEQAYATEYCVIVKPAK